MNPRPQQPRGTSVRPAPPGGTRRLAPAPAPRKGGAGRIIRWAILLLIAGGVAASFFVKTSDGRTYADAYLKPAWKSIKSQISPPAEESEAAKPAEKSELDKRFEAALEARGKFEVWLKSAAREGAAETAAEIEKRLLALNQEFESVSFDVSAEYKKPRAQRKTALDAPAVGEENAAFARIFKETALALSRLREALAVKAAEKPVEPPRPVEVPVVSYDLRKFHAAWTAHPRGTWVRWKVSSGGSVSWEDHVLATITDEAAVVRVQGFAGGKLSEPVDRVFAYGGARTLREEPLKVGDAEIPCRVVESGAVTRWIPREGRAADRLALKTAVAGQETVVTRIGEEEVPVKGEARKCLVYETGSAKLWAHEDVPGLLVRIEEGGTLREISDWGTDPAARPEFPKPPKAEPPPPTKPVLTRPHPWASFKPGAWARRKTLFESPTARTETSSDTILADATAEHVLQRIETLGPDGTVLSLDRKVPFIAEKPQGDETITLGATAIPCAVVETEVEGGIQKAWIAKEGPLAAVSAVLKLQGPLGARTATAIGQSRVPVGGRDVDGVTIQYEGRSPEGAIRETAVFCAEVPGFEVMRETVTQTPLGESRMTFRLIDFGDDPARKTALGAQVQTAAGAERRRIDAELAAAEARVMGGSALFRELAEAMRALPPEREALQKLLDKKERAATLLLSARETYTTVKPSAPAEAKLDEKLTKIEKVLELLARYGQQIEAKTKP